MDYETGGRMATEHLIARGARNIAFVGGVEDGPITQERMSGYRQVMAENGLQTVAFHGRATRKMGRDMAQKIAREHPEIEAAICFNDLVGLGMLSGFAQAAKVVGSDFLLVGFDDIEECEQAHPQLSSVRCDVEIFGKKSAELIVDWLDTGTMPPLMPREPVELIARQSSLGQDSHDRLQQ
jgi:LacI family transcriptional regulator